MQIGSGVKEEKAERAVSKGGELVEGEAAWFFAKCNNLRPMIDAIVVTNARVLGLSTREGYKYRAPIRDIASSEYDAKGRTVRIVTTDGQEFTFKSVPSDDVPAVEHYINYAVANPAPSAVTEAIVARGSAASSVLAVTGGSEEDFKAARKQQRHHDKQQRAQQKAELEAAERERIGQRVESAAFGGKAVRIYRNGYVSVGGAFGPGKAERLVSIEASSDVSKKSGVGRGAAAAMTMGLSLATSNKRGDVYLTIVTDRGTHVLHEEPPTAQNLKTSKRLEAAGNAVIQGTDAAPPEVDRMPSAAPAAASSAIQPPAAASQSSVGVAEKLRSLAAMRDEGLVTSEEYEAMRTKLLEDF